MTHRPWVVRLNGVDVEVPRGATLEWLLEREELAQGLVAVERNGEPVGRAEWEQPVEEGDEILTLRLVGGG